MIDFHSHTIFSDGGLSVAEHVRRAIVAGYKVLGITDHVDYANIEHVYTNIKRFVDTLDESYGWDIKVIPGGEITHVPAKQMKEIVDYARNELKMPLVIVHGESPVEPVEPGTNLAAIEAGVDILAHPGLLTDEEVKLAAQNNVSLEITSRRGHSLTNGHVAKLALKYGAPLVLDSDAHIHTDFLKPELRTKVLKGCGLDDAAIEKVEANIKAVAERVLARMK